MEKEKEKGKERGKDGKRKRKETRGCQGLASSLPRALYKFASSVYRWTLI